MKSQILYMIVYSTRYLDLFLALSHLGRLKTIQLYNTVMKVLFLSTQGSVLYYMTRRFRATYNPHIDTFRIEFAIIPCLVLALVFQDRSMSGFWAVTREVQDHILCRLMTNRLSTYGPFRSCSSLWLCSRKCSSSTRRVRRRR